MKRVYLGIAALGALVLATVASGAGTATPGITKTQVVIGGTVPLSGPAASYASVARGAQAYFKYVNAHGGGNKRKNKYIFMGDGYAPPPTANQTRGAHPHGPHFSELITLRTGAQLPPTAP